MAQTIVSKSSTTIASTIAATGQPPAIKKYSGLLFVDTARKSYWTRKFMGDGQETTMPIMRLTQLQSDAGEEIGYDINMQINMIPVEGDDVLENKEAKLKFYTDSVFIDQMRGGVNTGGRMSRKRTIHDLRKLARARQSDWWARIFDELFFMYLTGKRGNNSDYIFPTTYTGFAGNSFSSCDKTIYPDSITAMTSMTISTYANLSLIDKALAKIGTTGGGNQEDPAPQPTKINGEDHYVAIFHPFAIHNIKTQNISSSAGVISWLDIQKAAAAAEGKNSNIFKGAEGMYNNVVIHKHQGVIRSTETITDAASTSNISNGLFLGSQAAVVAFGSPGNNLRFDWHEEERDNGNLKIITSSCIFGIKKVTFNSKDFGVLRLVSYDADPNA